MSLHVFLARPGFKNEPIAPEEWLAVARGHAALSVREQKNRLGRVTTHVELAEDRSRLWLTPHGLVDAQEPSEPLVAVMFELAPRLGAAVYSEQLHRYASVADWERRTRDARGQRAANRAAARSRARLVWLRIGATVTVSMLVGWYLSSPG